MQNPNRPNQASSTNSTPTPAPRAPDLPPKSPLAVQTGPLVGDTNPNDKQVFTGEQTIVEQFAMRINAAWHKSTESILQVATDCAAADEKLNTSAKKALIARLAFDRVVRRDHNRSGWQNVVLVC